MLRRIIKTKLRNGITSLRKGKWGSDYQLHSNCIERENIWSDLKIGNRLQNVRNEFYIANIKSGS